MYPNSTIAHMTFEIERELLSTSLERKRINEEAATRAGHGKRLRVRNALGVLLVRGGERLQ
jgi:hypothetical protein